jgi:hypothetical protein
MLVEECEIWDEECSCPRFVPARLEPSKDY